MKSSLPAAVARRLERGELLAVRVDGEIEPVAPTATAITLRPGESITGRLDAARQISDQGVLDALTARAGLGKETVVEAIDLPFYTLEAPSDGQPVRELRPYILKSHLPYDSSRRRFAGRVHVGVRVIGGAIAAGPQPLEHKVAFTLATDADEVLPARLEFVRGNDAPLEVSLATSVSIDSVWLRLSRDDIADGDVSTGILLQRVLIIESPPRVLQGFGLESRRLQLAARGAGLSDSIRVTVSADAGIVTPTAVTIPREGSAEVTLKSDALGPITLTASAQRVAGTSATVVSVFPWRFVIATLLGLLVGAGASYLWLSGRKEEVNSLLFFGAMLGGLVTAAVAIGLKLNVTAFEYSAPLETSVALFALAALGSLIGVTVTWNTKKA